MLEQRNIDGWVVEGREQGSKDGRLERRHVATDHQAPGARSRVKTGHQTDQRTFEVRGVVNDGDSSRE